MKKRDDIIIQEYKNHTHSLQHQIHSLKNQLLIYQETTKNTKDSGDANSQYVG